MSSGDEGITRSSSLQVGKKYIYWQNSSEFEILIVSTLRHEVELSVSELMEIFTFELVNGK